VCRLRIVVLLAIYQLGSEKTRDDFIREVLFGAVTDTRYLGFFFAAWVLIIMFGGTLAALYRKRESDELQRCAEEKARLQELLAGRGLHHTAELTSGDASNNDRDGAVEKKKGKRQ
jgi:hypothetical protein